MMSIASLLAVALMGQNPASPVRIAPETLAWLRKGSDQLAEALEGRPATADTVAPKYAPALRKDRADKSLVESRARAARQLQDAFAKSAGAPALLSVKGNVATRTPLTGGGVRYDFGLSSGLLTPVSFPDEALSDEKAALETLGKAVFARLRIPKTAQSLLTGSMRSIALPNGRWVWGGVLEIGHAPDANGIYKISDSDSRWYDTASVWTDGEVLWVQYGRDDTIMGSANANP